MYQNLASNISKSRPHTSSIFMPFLDQIGNAELKNEMKTETGNSFRRHFGEKPNFRVFWAWYLGDTSMFGDDETGRSIGRPATLWTVELLRPGEPTPITLSVAHMVKVVISQKRCNIDSLSLQITNSRCAKYCDQPVCMSVYPLAYLINHMHQNFTKVSIHVTCDRGSVILWRQHNVMWLRFCNDIMFSHNIVHHIISYHIISYHIIIIGHILHLRRLSDVAVITGCLTASYSVLIGLCLSVCLCFLVLGTVHGADVCCHRLPCFACESGNDWHGWVCFTSHRVFCRTVCSSTVCGSCGRWQSEWLTMD